EPAADAPDLLPELLAAGREVVLERRRHVEPRGRLEHLDTSRRGRAPSQRAVGVDAAQVHDPVPGALQPRADGAGDGFASARRRDEIETVLAARRRQPVAPDAPAPLLDERCAAEELVAV